MKSSRRNGLAVSRDVLTLNPELASAGNKTARVSLRLDTLTAEPAFKSNTERRAWREWLPGQGAVAAFYEHITVHLNSGSYKPDFNLIMPGGELWMVEVKGSWNTYQSGRSSKKSLKEAAKMYAWLARWFSLLPAKGGGWTFEEVEP